MSNDSDGTEQQGSLYTFFSHNFLLNFHSLFSTKVPYLVNCVVFGVTLD